MEKQVTKAADISDDQVWDILLADERGATGHLGPSRWEFEAALPEYPPKVVLAKLRSMVKRGVIDGCACGCRGDFRVATCYVPPRLR